MPATFPLNPRHWVIRWLTPWVWRFFPSRKLSALQEFAAVERDSGRQLLDCIPLVAEPRLKAQLFQHVLEETFHGELFERVCHELSSTHLAPPARESDLLVSGKPGELAGVLSYVHVGESAVNRDFLCFAHVSRDPALREVFLRAGGDEGKHEGDTGDILFELCGRKKFLQARRIASARLKRWWVLYTGSTKRMGNVFLHLPLVLAYYPLGLFGFKAARRRFHLPEGEQVALLSEQVREFERRFP